MQFNYFIYYISSSKKNLYYNQYNYQLKKNFDVDFCKSY